MEGGDLNKKDGANRIVGESSSSYKERDEIKKKDGEGRLFADNKGKGPWVQKPRYFGGEVGGFSWPPRAYACSFCRREFRSAQALGGHMNVHRRDRARLRQSPPWVAQTSNPNFSTSNPFNLPPSSPSFPASHHSSQTCFISTSPSPSSSGQVKISDLAAASVHPRRRNTLSALFDIEAQGSRDFQVGGHRSDILKRREIVSLDLEIGLSRDSKDDLDLELRLGHT